MQIKPICFIEGNETKGFETEIIYRFAKAKKYNIKIINVNTAERIIYLQEGKADISGGVFSITEERKKIINFSNPVYTTGLALSIRKYDKKDDIQIKILDNNYLIHIKNLPSG